jgi:hypothetical protein
VGELMPDKSGGTMDKKSAAEKVRTRLEKRVALLLGCPPDELPRMKIGTMAHFLFLLEGCDQTIGGFETSMHALITLLGHEIVWADPTKVEAQEDTQPEPPKVVVN